MRRMTKRERISRQRLMNYIQNEQYDDMDVSLELARIVPQAWHTLEHDLDVWEEKVKITLRLDKSVAQFYRAMGQGCQARISRILALWAHMQICGMWQTDWAINEQISEWGKLNCADKENGETPHSYGSGVETRKEALGPGEDG